MSNERVRTGSLRLLEELPGIPDVVWAISTRLGGARSPTTVLFTAAEKRAGTSVLAAATAVGLAQHQRVSVALIETNVKRPALAGYLGLEGPGLSDVLDGRANLDDCVQELPECPGLLVLTAGTPRAAVSGEFTTDQVNSILAQLGQRCHYLVLDTAPVLDHVESRLLLRQADGVVLVLRARTTQRSDAERAHDILVESGATVLGSVFNDYRKEALFGDLGSADRAFQEAVRAERRRPSVRSSVGIGQRPVVAENLAAETNGKSPSVNGGNGYELPRPYANVAEAAHLRQIDLLERRIAKLSLQLKGTEANLRRIAAMKNVDLGIGSIYHGVQGLADEDEAREAKKTLLQAIFQANLELKAAMAQIS